MLCLSFRNETKSIPRHLFVFCLFTSNQTFAASITVENISKLPIHSVENSNSKANMTAIIGGKGLKNKVANDIAEWITSDANSKK